MHTERCDKLIPLNAYTNLHANGSKLPECPILILLSKLNFFLNSTINDCEEIPLGLYMGITHDIFSSYRNSLNALTDVKYFEEFKSAQSTIGVLIHSISE